MLVMCFMNKLKEAVSLEGPIFIHTYIREIHGKACSPWWDLHLYKCLQGNASTEINHHRGLNMAAFHKHYFISKRHKVWLRELLQSKPTRYVPCHYVHLVEFLFAPKWCCCKHHAWETPTMLQRKIKPVCCIFQVVYEMYVFCRATGIQHG